MDNSGGDLYRVPISKVLERLETRNSGLTKLEVNSRKTFVDSLRSKNDFADKSINRLTSSLSLRFSILIASIIVAFYFNHLSLSITLAIILLITGFSSGVYGRIIKSNFISSRINLPVWAKVIRENTSKKILVNNLVPGDIIKLIEGDIVPADIRIIKASNCIVNEVIFDKQLGRQLKKNTSLKDYAAPDKQSNMLFCGSSLVSGEASGVVVNVGSHTRLGELLKFSKPEPISLFSKRLTWRQKQIDIITLCLVSLILLSVAWPGTSLKTAVLLSGLIVVATSLADWFIAISIIAAKHTRILGKNGYRIKQLSSFELIATSNALVSDFSAAFTPQAPLLKKIHIGKKSIILDGKPIDGDQADKLQMFYTTLRLISELSDNDFSLVNTSLPSLSFGSFSFVSPLENNTDHSIDGGVWQSALQTITVVFGPAENIFKICDSIQDSDNVKDLSIKTKNDLIDHYSKNCDNGLAVAYSTDESPKDFTFVGVAEFSKVAEPESFLALNKLIKSKLAVILTSDESHEATVSMIKKIGLKSGDFTILEQADVDNIDLAKYLQIIKKPIVLNNVAVSSIAKLMEFAKNDGNVILNGERLEQPRLIKLADIVLARPGNIASEFAQILSPRATLSSIYTLINQSRICQYQLMQTRSLINLSFISSILLVLTFSVMTIFFNWATIINAPLLLFILLITCLPLLINVGWSASPNKLMSLKPSSLLKRVAPLGHQIFIGLLSACFAIAGGYLYLFINNVSPHYLVNGNMVFAKATTVVAVTLSICLLLHTLIAWRQDTSKRQRSVSRKYAVSGLFISVIAIISMVIYEPIMPILGSTKLDHVGFWLIAISSLIFALLTFIAEKDSQQSRREIMRLPIEALVKFHR